MEHRKIISNFTCLASKNVVGSQNQISQNLPFISFIQLVSGKLRINAFDTNKNPSNIFQISNAISSYILMHLFPIFHPNFPNSKETRLWAIHESTFKVDLELIIHDSGIILQYWWFLFEKESWIGYSEKKESFTAYSKETQPDPDAVEEEEGGTSNHNANLGQMCRVPRAAYFPISLG